MTRRLLLAYLTITAFALVVVVVPLGITFSARERDRLLFDLERDSQAVASRAEDDLESGTLPDLQAPFDAYDGTGARILVVDSDGRSVADSDGSALGRDYSTRPEIAAALQGRRVTGRRHSKTLGADLVYVAIPVASRGRVHGAVRITLPSSAVDRRVEETWIRLAALSAIVLATVGIVGLLLARSVTRPVRQLEDAARRLAEGDLSARAGDVSGPPEITELAAQFDATAERLEQVVEAQRRFVGDASHQLRTPLTALRLNLETLHPTPEDERRVAAALAETDRLSRLVQSLLEIARSEAAEPVVALVDLAVVATERRDTWTEVASRAGVDLVLESPATLVVQAVEGGVEQILDNLLSNAMAVAPAGSTLRIEVAARDGGGGRLTVTDQGPGMTADQRAQATARFWRPAGSTTSGSGLGLAIVDHLVLAGGGQLALEEGPGGVGLQVVVDFAAPRPAA
ncbi:MAG: HAMP domain-containing protein [Acidimicrobiales bacterium]